MTLGTATRLGTFSLALIMSACTTAPTPCPTPPTGDIVYVVGQGWHAEIGVPVNELGHDMRAVADLFPGARVLMVGYGKKTFFTAPAHSLSEYMLGPLPGPAVIHVVGLSVTPPEAYAPDSTVTLQLHPDGTKALSAYLANDIEKDTDGKPLLVARSDNPAGLFFAAHSEYNLLHTCNAWTVEALQASGLPLSDGDVVFAHQVLSRVFQVATQQCCSTPDQ